jgi:hypothetical protein
LSLAGVTLLVAVIIVNEISSDFAWLKGKLKQLPVKKGAL